VADGVRYQVLDDLLDAIGIANDLICTTFNLGRYRDVRLPPESGR
jgi:hypothetical protein